MVSNSKIARIAFVTLLFLVLVFLYGPLLQPILISLSATGQIDSGMTFTTRWYSEMIQNQMIGRSLWTSMVAAFLTAIIAPLLALIAALAIREFRAKRAIILLMILPLFIPPVTMGLASAFFLKLLGIPSSLLTIVLVQVIWALPFAFLVIVTVMASFNTIYLEAAYMSGANRWRAFVDVELPAILPGISGAAIFSGIIAFNETIRTTMVQGPYNTIQTYIWSTFLQVGLSPQLFAVMASLILITVAMVLVMVGISLSRPAADVR